MPAVTYSISLSEESAARFEKAASDAGLEPSEAICRLVREFVQAGGFPTLEANENHGDIDQTVQEQVDEWIALRAAHQKEQLDEAQSSLADEGAEPSVNKRGRAPLPWEDVDEPTPPWHSPKNSSSKLTNLAAKDIEAADFGVGESAPSANSWLSMRLARDKS